jgi:hypothetical protein
MHRFNVYFAAFGDALRARVRAFGRALRARARVLGRALRDRARALFESTYLRRLLATVALFAFVLAFLWLAGKVVDLLH